MERHLRRALVVAASALAWSATAVAGNGTITPGSAGSPALLNLTVYIDHDEQDVDRWKEVFSEGSKRIYDATEKQLQLGTVTVYKRCAAAKRRADVWILEDWNGHMSADVYRKNIKPGLKVANAHIYIDKRRFDSKNPGLALAHEIAHYVFSLHDEYIGKSYTWYEQPPYPDLGRDEHFCAEPGGKGPACIMNCGANVNTHRTEFCTAANHNTGHVSWSIFDGVAGTDVFQVLLNLQQVYRGQSCWDHIAEYSRITLGVEIKAPDGEPKSDTSGHAEIEWKVQPCPATVVLVLDRSGSMEGDPLAMAKVAATMVGQLLEDGTGVGLVTFNEAPTLVFDIKPLDDSVRQEIASAVAPLAADGGTNIGDALHTGLLRLQARSPREGPEAIVLLSDGDHTTGTPPEQVTPLLKADGVALWTLGFGLDFGHLPGLALMAEQLGGEARYTTDARRIPESLAELALAGQGRHLVRTDRGTLTPGTPVAHEVWVDERVGELTVALFAPGATPQLTIRDPQGAVLAVGGGQVEELMAGADAVAYRIANPASGSWQLEVDGAAAEGYSLKSYDDGAGFDVTARPFPIANLDNPVEINARVVGPGGYVTGAQVSATVQRPDGSQVTIPLHDDGAAAHADELGGDGIYGARFTDFVLGENGVYTFSVRADAREGKTATVSVSDQSGTPAQAAPVPRFERETAFSVVVTGIPDDLPGGVLTVEPLADEPAVDGSLDRSAARVPMVRFRLRSSAQEHALAELSFRDIGDGDLAHVAAARLYRDDDGDGYPDTEGDYADPIAEGTVDPATRRVSFSELWLPRHIDERFILTYDLDRPGRRSAAAAAGVRAAPWARWAPALLLAPLALLLLWRARKRRLVAAAVCGVALLAVALVGCPGDDEDDFVPGAYQVELELDRASAVGATGKAPFTVEGESVRGPRYRLE